MTSKNVVVNFSSLNLGLHAILKKIKGREREREQERKERKEREKRGGKEGSNFIALLNILLPWPQRSCMGEKEDQRQRSSLKVDSAGKKC